MLTKGFRNPTLIKTENSADISEVSAKPNNKKLKSNK